MGIGGTRHSLRDFDPHEVARLETRMWRSYYDHCSLRLFADLVTLLRQQYHLPFLRACAGAYHAARGAVVFERGHNRAEHLLVPPDVVRYYKAIRSTSAKDFPVQQVSEAELEWWIVHRQRDQHAAGDLAHALAVEQAELYHQPESDFAENASARADAMRLRDRGTAAGGVSEADWGSHRRHVGVFLEFVAPRRQSISPLRTAKRTSSLMLCTLSFSMMRPRWASTV